MPNLFLPLVTGVRVHAQKTKTNFPCYIRVKAGGTGGREEGEEEGEEETVVEIAPAELPMLVRREGGREGGTCEGEML